MGETLKTLSAYTLGPTFVSLSDGAAIDPVPIDDSFWTRADDAPSQGRLVSYFRTESDWSNWEMHPDGDEFILQLDGAIDLIAQIDGRDMTLRLEAGHFTIVPRQVWHTADVVVAGHALYITRGNGTQSRPRD